MLRRGRALIATVVLLVSASCYSPTPPGELSVYGPYVGPEADVFGEVLDRFEAETGITTTYVGTSSFQTDFTSRMNANDLPDVSVLPQMALLDPLLARGDARPLDEEASRDLMDQIGGNWSAIVAPEGSAIAVPYRFVVKSIVWYRSDIFAERGYEPPDTLAELETLSRRMIEDGYTPWCAGMDDAGATGWWATDWVEDLVVRRAGISRYWSWATLQTPFTDEDVVAAMREFQGIVDAQDAFLGGPRGVVTVRVEDAIAPMFDEEPGCLMHKQGSFQPIWLPHGVEFGDGRLDIFPLPGVEPGPPPMLISGEVVVATSDDPAAIDLLEYLLAPDAFEPWLERSGSLVATASASDVPSENELDRRLTDMVVRSPAVVIDASDIMPQQIGTGAFFSGMIDLVAGKSPSEVAGEIQDAVDTLPGR